MKRLALALTVILAVLSATLILSPIVHATVETECTGCRHTIKVIPVGTESAESNGPLVTTTPADLMIFHTGSGKIKNVWLVIVLNKPTYDALDRITINGSTFMTKADFTLIPASTKKIPPASAKPSIGYPGSECRYEVAAVKSNMEEAGNPIYYGYKFFLDKIRVTPPNYFTLALEFTSPVSSVKALMLAIGRYEHTTLSIGPECISPRPFNVCSSFSKSTLVVPELATMALVAAPFGAIGFLRVAKRKK